MAKKMSYFLDVIVRVLALKVMEQQPLKSFQRGDGEQEKLCCHQREQSYPSRLE